jgi:hypothetical protein
MKGGPEGIRTPDLLHAMQTRSQLRHRPVRSMTAYAVYHNRTGPRKRSCPRLRVRHEVIADNPPVSPSVMAPSD